MKNNFDIIIPFGISFVCSIMLNPIVTNILIKLKAFQSIRKEGVKKHLTKAKTPLMGGIIILTAAIAGCAGHIPAHTDIKIMIYSAIGFGIIGFADDYLKVIKKNPKGLSPLKKFTVQIILTSGLILYLSRNGYDFNSYKLPFLKNVNLNVSRVLALIINYTAFIGTVNGVNFTDGIDGLAGSVTFLVLTFFAVIAICSQNCAAVVLCAFCGALIGFLFYNSYPAKIFMGDTGSLALGGLVAATAFVLKMPLILPIVGIVYLIEVISVIIQVSYFKITHGKRFFKMAPVHHHFELCGYSENQIVFLFSVVTAIACLIAVKGV